MFLVVFQHFITHLRAGLPNGELPTWFDLAWQPVTALRLPMLFFVSGIFLPRSLAKGESYFWKSKPLRMTYLFVVWWLILFPTDLLNRTVVGDMSLLEAIKLGVYHEGLTMHTVLWYLAALALYYTYWRITLRLPLLLNVLTAVFIYFLSGIRFDGPLAFITRDLLKYLIFFMAGTWLNTKAVNRIPRTTNLTVGISLLLLGSAYYMLSRLMSAGAWRGFQWAVWLGIQILSILLFLILCHRIEVFRFAKVGHYLGARTLPIYVMHWPIVMFFSELIIHWGHGRISNTVFVLSTCVLSVVVPGITLGVKALSGSRTAFLWDPPFQPVAGKLPRETGLPLTT